MHVRMVSSTIRIVIVVWALTIVFTVNRGRAKGSPYYNGEHYLMERDLLRPKPLGIVLDIVP